MSRIRGLELLFNLEKKNIKSREDCIVVALHCLLINENWSCVGIGDEWPDSTTENTTELLPENWNNNQDVFSLRYVSKNKNSRILLKITKMEHILHVDVAMNEDTTATLSVPVADYVLDNYNEYSTTYKDLESLTQSFAKDIMQKFQPKATETSKKTSKVITGSSSDPPRPPLRPQTSIEHEKPQRYPFPRVGGSDLDPFGCGGGGGMLMDPSGFGIPSRPTLPQFGIGGPSGLPRGSVPPGARFDPFSPPIRPQRYNPDRDHFKPPDFDDFI